ncbi:hypothetical protein J7E96_31190 [Streptomyces sp. ISL-96]|uniref:hypothetical protein n=1 Tax=Streptomyces sp. ISL-96 TaxID=2819191 RepID=UPI001BEC50D4|nr:hypothetical protein [Streptomyces sp. ISL-96]MBT2492898.1 hypothetical protein [Streptomyces sp. ISL-96]
MSNLSPDTGSGTGAPRWVKVFAIITVVVVVLFVILLLTKGPGGHGPSRHMSIGESGVQMISASVIEGIRR